MSMPLFQYRAYNTIGKTVRGMVQAASLELAKENLRKEKLIVVELGVLAEKKQKKEMKAPLVISFTRDMAQLLKAGLPVYESLLTIEEKLGKHPSRALVLDLIEQIRQGKTLSQALSLHPTSFDAIYCSMVTSAEKSGSLVQTFQEIYGLLVRQNKLKKQLISSLTYPAILAGFCLMVSLALFLFVVPSMRELFEGRALHPMTQTVLAISLFLQRYGIYILGALIAFVASSVFLLRSRKGKHFIYLLLHRLPLVKKVLLHAAIVRFSRTLSLLLKSSVGLIDALYLSKKVTRHPFIEEMIDKGAKKVLEGEPLSSQLVNKVLPPLVPRMVSLAEETGKMPEMLYSLADIYEEELERHLFQITTLLQPLLLLLLGVIIGGVVLSILLPLTDVSSFL